MQKQLTVSASPHIRSDATTRRIMLDVIIALIPAGIMSVVWFGVSALTLIAICVCCCVIFEYGYEKLDKRASTVGDLSAVVTGLLLAYNLPSTAPWWIAVIGSFLAIVLVKQVFGGIGSNFMNPALTARVILFISWSSIMGSYPNPDAVTGATPLNSLANGTAVNLWDLLIGRCGGVLGETCKLALIVGGIYLLVRGVISWHIPATFIATVFVCYLIKSGSVNIALGEVLSGGLMLGAIFMATDYVSSPVTKVGKIIMGFGCGIMLFVIRAYANYIEGCSFAILFMNVCTPLIDRLTGHKPFGEVKKNG